MSTLLACFTFSNFSNYRERFSMPGNTEGIYYRYDRIRAESTSVDTTTTGERTYAGHD